MAMLPSRFVEESVCQLAKPGDYTLCAAKRDFECNRIYQQSDPNATGLPRRKVFRHFDNHVRTCRELTPISLNHKPHRLAFQLTASRRRLRPY